MPARTVAQRGFALLFPGKIRRVPPRRAIPTIAGTFSVPGRRSFSCAPPNWMRLDGNPGAQVEQAGAFRAVEFVRGKAGGIDSAEIGRLFAERLHHVAVQENAALAAEVARFPPSVESRRFRCSPT